MHEGGKGRMDEGARETSVKMGGGGFVFGSVYLARGGRTNDLRRRRAFRVSVVRCTLRSECLTLSAARLHWRLVRRVRLGSAKHRTPGSGPGGLHPLVAYRGGRSRR